MGTASWTPPVQCWSTVSLAQQRMDVVFAAGRGIACFNGEAGANNYPLRGGKYTHFEGSAGVVWLALVP